MAWKDKAAGNKRHSVCPAWRVAKHLPSYAVKVFGSGVFLSLYIGGVIAN
jgi:hypothetical protein